MKGQRRRTSLQNQRYLDHHSSCKKLNYSMADLRKTATVGDKFIPSRRRLDLDVARLHPDVEDNIAKTSPSKIAYRKVLSLCLFGEDTKRVFRFQKEPTKSYSALDDTLLPQLHAPPKVKLKPPRSIPLTPEHHLDAPGLLNDYYLNLLDWSSTDIVAVGLCNTVYLWDASTKSPCELFTVKDDVGPIASVGWAADGGNMAVGMHNYEVQLWDCDRQKQTRNLSGHDGRVGCIAWNGSSIVSTGSIDTFIINHGVRIRESAVQRLRGHTDEICGLKWAPEGKYLASCGNDDTIHVWDPRRAHTIRAHNRYLHRFTGHSAAVKALAWCPFQTHLLASGGGTADKCIKFWNVNTGACLNTICTDSQVSGLLWSRHERELLSSHGYLNNHLTLWKYPSMSKTAELTGHTQRVLHIAQSPDGCTVVSASADESIRFWNVFGDPTALKKHRNEEDLLNKFVAHIR